MSNYGRCYFWRYKNRLEGKFQADIFELALGQKEGCVQAV